MSNLPEGRTVLLVEDVAVNRRVAAAFLAKQGLNVVEAVTGAEALQAVSQQTFDLILLDIRLPDMDGVEVARQMRSQTSALSQTPILALTANVFPDDIKRYRQVGMNGVVAKPIQLDQFRKAVGTILSRPPTSSAVIGKSPAGEVVGEGAQLADAVIDDAFIEERLETLGKETFLTILRIGQRSLSEAVRDFMKARATEDATALAKAAHKLAGAASNFGYSGLFHLGKAIEASIVDGGPTGLPVAMDKANCLEILLQHTQEHLLSWLKDRDLPLDGIVDGV